jgi:glycosyltransferase involved in cell wall biosynthesis
MTRTGLVIIGRNEGERLARCLRSIPGGFPVCYVDSGSTDGSVAMALRAGAAVVELDSAIPFSAARARNTGLRQLLKIEPGLEYVQFVDGDCELATGWIETGISELERRPELAVVCGILRERAPEASVYNRLCDLEWNGGFGEIAACGGVAMHRVSAFVSVGGFNPSVPAGEEPELCLRLRQQGWRIARVPQLMALHDVAMIRFGQWWKRQVRGGYGALDVVRRFDGNRRSAFARQVRSGRLWVIGWPSSILLAGLVGGCTHAATGALIGAGAVGALAPLQAFRLALKMLRKGAPLKVAVAHGVLTLIGKWANITGQWQYVRDRRAGRNARLIEHKVSGTVVVRPSS